MPFSQCSRLIQYNDIYFAHLFQSHCIFNQNMLAQPGQTLLPETLCAQQLRLIETCEQYRRANVSVKHIFGLLSVSGVQARVQK